MNSSHDSQNVNKHVNKLINKFHFCYRREMANKVIAISNSRQKGENT